MGKMGSPPRGRGSARIPAHWHPRVTTLLFAFAVTVAVVEGMKPLRSTLRKATAMGPLPSIAAGAMMDLSEATENLGFAGTLPATSLTQYNLVETQGYLDRECLRAGDLISPVALHSADRVPRTAQKGEGRDISTAAIQMKDTTDARNIQFKFASSGEFPAYTTRPYPAVSVTTFPKMSPLGFKWSKNGIKAQHRPYFLERIEVLGGVSRHAVGGVLPDLELQHVFRSEGHDTTIRVSVGIVLDHSRASTDKQLSLCRLVKPDGEGTFSLNDYRILFPDDPNYFLYQGSASAGDSPNGGPNIMGQCKETVTWIVFKEFLTVEARSNGTNCFHDYPRQSTDFPPKTDKIIIQTNIAEGVKTGFSYTPSTTVQACKHGVRNQIFGKCQIREFDFQNRCNADESENGYGSPATRWQDSNCGQEVSRGRDSQQTYVADPQMYYRRGWVPDLANKRCFIAPEIESYGCEEGVFRKDECQCECKRGFEGPACDQKKNRLRRQRE